MKKEFLTWYNFIYFFGDIVVFSPLILYFILKIDFYSIIKFNFMIYLIILYVVLSIIIPLIGMKVEHFTLGISSKQLKHLNVDHFLLYRSFDSFGKVTRALALAQISFILPLVYELISKFFNF